MRGSLTTTVTVPPLPPPRRTAGCQSRTALCVFDQLQHDQAPDFGRRAGSLRETLGSSMERATGIEPAPSVWKSDPGVCLQRLVIMDKCLQAPVLLVCRALAREG